MQHDDGTEKPQILRFEVVTAAFMNDAAMPPVFPSVAMLHTSGREGL